MRKTRKKAPPARPAVKAMTLRDYFAGQALAGMLAADDSSYERAAGLAYGYADALLKQRAKPQGGEGS